MGGSSADSKPPARAWIDGACRGNPGPAAAGWVIVWPDGSREEGCRALGEGTNNVAEYRALLFALERLAERGAARAEIRSDSELLVRQMAGRYKVRHPALKPLHAEARSLLGRIGPCDIFHVPREENRDADRLANRALDLDEDCPARDCR